jgi:hypothetical protein
VRSSHPFRAKVEGGIGTIKAPRYGFNRPAARSAPMTVGRRHAANVHHATDAMTAPSCARLGKSQLEFPREA